MQTKFKDKESLESALAASPGIRSISICNIATEGPLGFGVYSGNNYAQAVYLSFGKWVTFHADNTPNLKPGMPWAPYVMIGTGNRNGTPYFYNPNGVDIYFNLVPSHFGSFIGVHFDQTSDRPL